MNEKGYYTRGRRGYASSSGYESRLEAALARVRQTDDLLPALDIDACGYTRGSYHFNAC